jgi:hypothetical protein
VNPGRCCAKRSKPSGASALAGSVPRGEVRVVDAGHLTMHYRYPDTVVQAVQDLLGR